MPEPTFQTVRLRRGNHKSPDEGACVVELASMLAGEPFTDRPRSVCPVIAAFLRAYNDVLPDRDRDVLYPYAALVVGSRASRKVCRQRTRVMLEWLHPDRPGWLPWLGRVETWSWIAATAAHTAVAMEPERRDREVDTLLRAMLAVGNEQPAAGRPAASAARVGSSREPAAVD